MARLASNGSATVKGQPPGSDPQDEDSINQQIQSELESQVGTQESKSHAKRKKRKARDEAEELVGGDDEGAKKKKKKKKTIHTSSSKTDGEHHETPVPIPSSFTAVNAAMSSPAAAKSKRKGKEERKSIEFRDPLVTDEKNVHRPSLGATPNALLASILKSCSPEKTNTGGSKSPDVEEDTVQVSTVAAKSDGADKKRKRLSATSQPIKLPEGYKPIIDGDDKRYPCPVDICESEYSRRDTLILHMKSRHGDQLLQDNKDGTMSIVGPISKNEEAVVQSISPSLNPVPKVAAPVLAANSQVSHSDTEVVPDKKTAQSKESETVEKTKSNKTSKPNGTSAKNAALEEAALTKALEFEVPAPKKKRRSSKNAVANLIPGRGSAEMEDWELSTGKITNRVANDPANDDDDDDVDVDEDDIAFSAFYVDKHESGVTFGGINFNIMRLSGGASQSWECPSSIIYLCSVASGKIHVKISHKDFTIGANGAWCVRAGEVCEVVNRHYGDAVVHICTTRE